MRAKQKTFPIVGVRIPAADMKDFPKRPHTICLRVDPSLYDALHELASRIYMKVSPYCMRVLWSWVGEQQLLGNHGNQRNHQRGTA